MCTGELGARQWRFEGTIPAGETGGFAFAVRVFPRNEALAGRFASQQHIPPGAGTLPTHRPLFVGLLTAVALVVVGLTYIPVLALGPIVESLS